MSKLLPSEKNTQSTERVILRDARGRFGRRRGMQAVYEHGHWWLTVPTDNGTLIFDVVDTRDGFDFEAV